jgi:hypothetical protein
VLANSGGGLRGGSWSAHGRRLTVTGYQAVPGVTLTGGGTKQLTLQIGGAQAAHGTVTLRSGGRLAGTLGGRRIRLRVGTSAAAPARVGLAVVARRHFRAVTLPLAVRTDGFAPKWSRSGRVAREGACRPRVSGGGRTGAPACPSPRRRQPAAAAAPVGRQHDVCRALRADPRSAAAPIDPVREGIALVFANTAMEALAAELELPIAAAIGSRGADLDRRPSRTSCRRSRCGRSRAKARRTPSSSPRPRTAASPTRTARASPRSSRVGGTGLGLALAHEIVAAHGGHMGFESVEGSRFWFTLPSG